jgi:hypothetical protein
MKQSKWTTLFLCLVLNVTATPPAFAEGKTGELPKAARPRSVMSLRPIGIVESMGALTIDGRLAKGQELLWGSELIQAPDNASARLLLNTVGQASLNPASIVRVTTVTSTDGNKIEHPTLIATLVKGSLSVQLQSGAMAYLRSGQSSFVASTGTHFVLEMREDSLAANALRGTIINLGQWTLTIPTPVLLAAERIVRMQEQTKPRKYIIKPYNFSLGTEVRARASRQIQVRVTDENDRPVPDLPIVFTLTGSAPESIGSLNAAGLNGLRVSANTNTQGIATVRFTANTTIGSVPISAGVAGATTAISGTIYVSAGAAFWTMATALPVIATAAVATVAGATVAAKQDKKEPVSTTLPAPVIRP